MITSHRLRIRVVENVEASELDIDEVTLREELLLRDNLGPETQVWFEGRWIPLRDYPQPTWVDEMVRHAIAAARQSRASEVEWLARKVLRFSAGGDSNEVVRVANFLLGHLRMCAHMYREAIDLLQSSVRGPSCVLAASHNNLGVAWAYLRNPVAALKHLELAAVESRNFFAPELSRWNLAATLVDENAPPIPGHAAWNEIAEKSKERLRNVSAGAIHALLDPHRVFPSFHVLHIFPQRKYFPPLSSQMSRPNHEELAGRRLLDEADGALADQQYELALELARSAIERCPTLRDSANKVIGVAAARQSEAEALGNAKAYISDLKKFTQAMDAMSLETLDSPRAPLALLASYPGDMRVWERTYRRRVEQLALEAISTCEDVTQQTRLLELAATYAEPQRAAAYRQAAEWRRAGKSLETFQIAVLSDNLGMADSALRQAVAILGVAPEDNLQVLKHLRQRHADDALVLDEESLRMAESLRRQIASDDFDQAKQTLGELLWKSPAAHETFQLRGSLGAESHLAQARESLRAQDWRDATEQLREAIQHDPRCRHGLMLAFALELLLPAPADDGEPVSPPMVAKNDEASPVPTPQLTSILDDGMAAIQGFLAGDALRCRTACDKVLLLFPSSWVMRHLQNSLPADEVK